MQSFLREERGTVLIMATFMFTLALLFLVLLVDIGTMHIMKARLETAVDAATLAAVQTTKVEATFETREHLVRNIFLVDQGSQVASLEAQGRVKSKQEIGHMETRTVEDPLTGQIVKKEVFVLDGWYVIYRDGWDRVVTKVEPKLDQVEADEAAREVIRMNVLEWMNKEPGIVGTFVGPITSEDYTGRMGDISFGGQTSAGSTLTVVQYSIPWVSVYTKSFFAGPLTSFLTGGPIEESASHKPGAQETGTGHYSSFIQLPVTVRRMGAAATINK